MTYAGAATVMMEIPAPRMKRATVSCATVLAVHAITAPTMMTIAPLNIAQRRPNRSEMTAAKGDVTIVPLFIC